MKDLWLATANAKKLKELDRLLEGEGYRLRSIADLPEPIDIVEDGDTFAANAEIKASTLAELTGGLAVGDDSGLSVEALDGRPGIRSARYAGPDATDADRIEKLLGELRERPEAGRRAWFTCSICLSSPDGVVSRFEDHCYGVIAEAPRGVAGFGYDPVFLPDEYADQDPKPSFAELTPAQKDAISHRGRALRQLIEHLQERT